MATLPISDIVNIPVIISPVAAIGSNFNLALIVGSSAAIGATERVRVYSSAADMLLDGFVSNSAEYLAAQLYFSQTPTPQQVVIGRWDSGSESAVAAVTDCRAKNTNWYLCTVCGAADADILAVAAYIEAAQPSGAYFVTTADAAVLNATALAAGYETGAVGASTDIHLATSPTFKIAVDGDTVGPTYKNITLTPAGLITGALIAAAMQTAIQAQTGIYSAVTVIFVGGVYVITSGTAGILSKVRVAAGTANDVAATLKIGSVNGAVDTDGLGSIALSLKGKSYRRTLTQYSTAQDAVAAIMGYAMGANTGANNSAYTLAYKQEVGVTPEALTENQLTILKGQNVNYYINRGNTYNLFEPGMMANGAYFDELLGLDMLVNDIQFAVMNLLTSVAKVPQTEGGVTQIIDAIAGRCRDARNTGFLAPGIWNAAPIMNLQTGDALSQGFLIMAQSINSQSEADRTARIAPPIYVAVKLAGAIQYVTISIYVNR